MRASLTQYATSRRRNKPFGGYLAVRQQFEGSQLKTRVEAGNFLETDEVAFSRATTTAARFQLPWFCRNWIIYKDI
jgi:hypothetical protein